MEWTNDLDELVVKIKSARREKRGASIGYHGNVVSVWYLDVTIIY